MAHTATVLKIVLQDNIHRVTLGPVPEYSVVDAAVGRAFPDVGPCSVTFTDAKGEAVVLSESSFGSFMATSKVGPTGRPVLRLDVKVVEDRTLQAASSSDVDVSKGSKAARRTRRKPATSSAEVPWAWEEDVRDLEELVRELVGEEENTAEEGKRGLKSKASSKKKRRQQGGSKKEEGALRADRLAAEAPRVEQAKLVLEVRLSGVAKTPEHDEQFGSGQKWHGKANEAAEGLEFKEADFPGIQAERSDIHRGHDDREDSCSAEASQRAKTQESSQQDIAASEPMELAAEEAKRSRSASCPGRLIRHTLADSDGEQEPLPQLWPATPESTPPTSPRDQRGQWPQVSWVPAHPAWISAA